MTSRFLVMDTTRKQTPFDVAPGEILAAAANCTVCRRVAVAMLSAGASAELTRGIVILSHEICMEKEGK